MLLQDYGKNLKNLDTPKIAAIILKFEQCGFHYRVIHQKDAEGMANGVHPDWQYDLGLHCLPDQSVLQHCILSNIILL